MDYRQTIDYLFQSLPMFQRIGTAAYKANLDNTIALCNLLDNPQQKFKSIHIAGTNGKGSTSHYIASILQEAGYKVGLYTSPHLKDFRERIKINGKMISRKKVVDFVSQYKNDFESIQPSFFEMTVGLAFDYFAKQEVDIAVIEVGLGGRLDSTNVINPLLSVITNISFDHTALLGNTLDKIATEKAGIIKSKTTVVIGEFQLPTKNVFISKAKEKKAPIYFAETEFEVESAKSNNGRALNAITISYKNKTYLTSVKNPLKGIYQFKNIATVCCAIEQLKSKGFTISQTNIRKGIQNVITNTTLLGRWQILSKVPLTIADTGHNEAGLKMVLQQIKNTPHSHLHFVLGMVNDKDISTILSLLPKNATYYFCKANIPRGLAAEELAKFANEKKLNGVICKSVKAALKIAQKQANKKDLVFVGGSTFTVAEVV